ncbi:26224_t:CDS:2 [Gigaspora margarita]|uniref:26224_t:CDS:1 n=1 Tax=Gigaspora margarita TaxID=4874 RepID=A0ABN7URT8_GIGMA|nr:26224_t:CDS:2 [Gigaspora margarita]
MVKWYEKFIAQNPDKRLVRENDPELEVLPLYKQLEPILLKESSPMTAGYYHYLTKDEKNELIPLLPGYTVFFYIEKKFWKFSIISEDSHLKFLWSAYDDNDLQILSVTKSNYCLFGSARPYYDPKNCRSLPYLLGFIEAGNVALLQAIISKHYSDIFEHQQRIINATKSKELLCTNLKRKADQISNDFNEAIYKTSKVLVKYNILLEKEGKILPPKSVQALILEYSKEKAKTHSLNQKITQLKKKIEQLEGELDKNNINENDLLEINIKNMIKSNKLDYLHKPIVAFHMVEKTRFMKDNKLELTKTIHKGNFNKSSKQMKHAILIKVLNQVSPSLEEAGLYLEICIDGDLDSNKTLANVPIVSNVYADLKHLTKNIKNLYIVNKKYIRFHAFEDHIMCWFRGCIYSAALRKVAQDSLIPSEEETRNMQVEGLICHLQNNHSSCWSDICWTKDDLEIILQKPTLCHLSNNQINEF